MFSKKSSERRKRLCRDLLSSEFGSCSSVVLRGQQLLISPDSSVLPSRIPPIDRSFIPPLTQSIQTHLLTLTTRHRSISHILGEYKALGERFDVLDEDAIQLLRSLGLDVEGMEVKNQTKEADDRTTSSTTNAIQDLDILTSTIESTAKSLDELSKTLEEKSEAMDEVEETMGRVVPVIVRHACDGLSAALWCRADGRSPATRHNPYFSPVA